MINQQRLDRYTKETREIVAYLKFKGKYTQALRVIETHRLLEGLIKINRLLYARKEEAEGKTTYGI